MGSSRILAGQVGQQLTAGEVSKNAIGWCRKIAECKPDSIAGVLAAMTTEPLFWTFTMGGFVLLQWLGDRKNTKQLQEHFAKLAKVLEDIQDEGETSAAALRRLEDRLESVMDHEEYVLARLPGYEKHELAEIVAEHVEKHLTNAGINPQAPLTGDDGIRVYLSNMSDWLWDLRNQLSLVVEGMARIEAQLQPIIDKQQQTILAQAQANADLTVMLTNVSTERDDLREQLESANRELVEHRLREGKSIDNIFTELRESDPYDLFNFLRSTIPDEEAEYERSRQRLIARHREIAIIGLPLGKIDEAKASFERLLVLQPDDINAINMLGNIAYIQGDLPLADERCQRVLSLANGNKQLEAVALGNLSMIEQTRGNLTKAESYLKRSLSLNESLGRVEGMAIQLGNLGLIEQTRGNLARAELYHKRSLSLNESLGRKVGMAIQLGNLGLIERTRGNLARAEFYHKRSLSLNEGLGRKEGVASQLGNLGLIEQMRGNLTEAESYHKRSLSLAEALGHKELIANQLAAFGLIELMRGNLETAEDYYKRSLPSHEAIGCKESVASTLRNLGLIEQTRGKLTEAESYFKRSLTLYKELGQKVWVAATLGSLGVNEQAHGNISEARRLWTQSRDLFAEIGMTPQREQLQSWIDQLPSDDSN